MPFFTRSISRQFFRGNNGVFGYVPNTFLLRGPEGLPGPAGQSVEGQAFYVQVDDVVFEDNQVSGVLDVTPPPVNGSYTETFTPPDEPTLDPQQLMAFQLTPPEGFNIVGGVWEFSPRLQLYDQECLLGMSVFRVNLEDEVVEQIGDGANSGLTLLTAQSEAQDTLLRTYVGQTNLNAGDIIVVTVFSSADLPDNLDWVYGTGALNLLTTTFPLLPSAVGQVGPTGPAGTTYLNETEFLGFQGLSFTGPSPQEVVLLPQGDDPNQGAVMVQQVGEGRFVFNGVIGEIPEGLDPAEPIFAGSALLGDNPVVYVSRDNNVQCLLSDQGLVVRGGVPSPPDNEILSVDTATGLTFSHQRFGHGIYAVPTGSFTGTVANTKNSTFLIASDFSGGVDVFVELPTSDVAIGQIFHVVKNSSNTNRALKVVAEGGGLINGSASAFDLGAQAYVHGSFVWCSCGYVRYSN
jgi:hypothetical protein